MNDGVAEEYSKLCIVCRALEGKWKLEQLDPIVIGEYNISRSMMIKAPFDGMVGHINVQKGQCVNSFQECGRNDLGCCRVKIAVGVWRESILEKHNRNELGCCRVKKAGESGENGFWKNITGMTLDTVA